MAETKKNVATETINGNLVIVREAILGADGKQLITKDDRPYFAYVVRGMVRGKEKKVDFVPKDKGGYEPLDILFDIAEKAELIMSEEEMTDDNGKKTKYTAYKAMVVDEDGDVYDCGIKPQRDSDKALLKFLLIDIKKKQKIA